MACVGPVDADRAVFETWRQLLAEGDGCTLLTKVVGAEPKPPGKSL